MTAADSLLLVLFGFWLLVGLGLAIRHAVYLWRCRRHDKLTRPGFPVIMPPARQRTHNDQ